MISDKQEKYDWEFIFLGANIDAASEAESIGIKRQNAVKYENSKMGVSANFEAAAELSKDVAMDKKESSKWREKVVKDK
jgi:von willebrand factor type A domain protein